MLVRLGLVLLAAMIGSGAHAATPPRTQAQVSQCLNSKVAAYRRAMGTDRDITAAQLQEWEGECGYRSPPAPKVSGAEAARVARAGQSLYTLAAIRSLLQRRTQGNSALPVPIPRGTVSSQSDGNFAITQVCEFAACALQSTVIVDVTTGDTAFCSFYVNQPKALWYFEGQPLVEEDARSCPASLAAMRPDFVSAWRQAQRDRGLRPVASLEPAAAPQRAAPALAQSVRTPPAGSAERQQIMDAIRPHIERDTGAPVEFVVRSLRLQGDQGFAMLEAQRPGGRPIDIRTTPLARAQMRNGSDEPMIDCCHAEAVLRRTGGRWQVVAAGFGSTDVWYEDWCRNRLPKGLCPGW